MVFLGMLALSLQIQSKTLTFAVAHVFTNVRHDMFQFCGINETVVFLVKDSESLFVDHLGVGLLHLTGHECAELGEIDFSRTWGVGKLINGLLKFIILQSQFHYITKTHIHILAIK